MAMQYTQQDRLISVTTPLGKDAFLLAGFRGTETVSRLFNFELDLLSSNPAIAFEDIIGKRATIRVDLGDGRRSRYFNGVISRFSQTAGQESDGSLRLSRYRASLVPWTWLLTRTSDARIFQNLSVPDILNKIFREKGFSDVSLELQGSYNPREYCVQYRETDFNFISRLLEEEGIYYYYAHSEKTHTMVIADAPGKHKKLSRPVRHYRITGAMVEEDTIAEMEKFQEVRAGAYTLNDFNFEIPNATLKANMDSGQKLGPGEREMYDYPGGYEKKADGDRLARLRMEEEEARITTISGAGNCREFCSGYRFTLKNALRQDMNDKEYVLISVSHQASQPLEQDSVPQYKNSFTCIPFEVPFRPPLTTPKPMIHGSQTAIVVGKAGEEIYVDKYGRVKVQFHWDREGKKDENASCWIRVGQIWAGSGWGAVWIPRIGHEVIVTFLEGDPDRPLITGSVYDGNNMPPYALPGEMTKSTIKSNATKGGGGFNELRFEDKKGAEEIYLHGQKDWVITIGNDKTQTVGHDETMHVQNDRKEDVDGNETIHIKKNRSNEVDADEKIAVHGNRSRQIDGDEQVVIGQKRTKKIGADETVVVSGGRTSSVGKDETLDVGGDRSESIGKNDSVNVGKKLLINAGDEIVLKSGSASITLKKNGDILLDGGKISIQGSSTINIKGSGDVKIKGSKILTN